MFSPAGPGRAGSFHSPVCAKDRAVRLVFILFWGSYLRLALFWEGVAPPVGDGAVNVGASYLVSQILPLLKTEWVRALAR